MMLVPVLFLMDWLQARSFKSAKVYLEKIPFILVAVIFVYLTSAAQVERWGDLDKSGYDQMQKVFLACTAFFQYVVKGLAPLDLSAYYPYPKDNGQVLAWYHYASPAFMLAFIAAAIYAYRQSRKLFFALAFFFINLVLMLKFLDVPFGNYLMADRYIYLPLVGLMLLVVIVLRQLAVRYSGKISLQTGVVIGLSLLFGTLSYQRIKVWNNSVDLWSDIINDYPNYRHAYNMRALGHIARNENQAAIKDFKEVIAIDPNFMDAYINLGILQYRLQRSEAAVKTLKRAKDLFSEEARVFAVSANINTQLKRPNAALRDMERALQLKPENKEYRFSRAQILVRLGRTEQAKTELRNIGQHPKSMKLLQALRNEGRQGRATVDSNNKASSLVERATTLAKQGHLKESLPLFDEAIANNANDEIALVNRGSTHARLGNYQAALADFDKARQINPAAAKNYYLMGLVYKDLQQKKRACSYFGQARQLGWQLDKDQLSYCQNQ
ncbi:MAG: tetratricopeptide repeat protein [Owenweeksia sp.]|nr:tetratricopeptide repeat protein [Owenweeksia sp.]